MIVEHQATRWEGFEWWVGSYSWIFTAVQRVFIDFINEQICARMTNVGPNAPDGPLNGSEPNTHVFDSPLPVCSGCSRAVNVGQNRIACTFVT